MTRGPGERPVINIESEGRRELRENIRMTFLMFCHLVPTLAEQYLKDLRADGLRYHDILNILGFPNALPRAAPAALVDFMIAALMPDEEPDSFYSRRRDYGPFYVTDSHFFPASPGQGPFFELLESAPAEGLRLVRAVVEHATDWRRESYVEEGEAFPV
jgi:hypothetical protein